VGCIPWYRPGFAGNFVPSGVLEQIWKETPVPGLKIAIQLASLKQNFRKALATAAELGASAVEIEARGEINAQTISNTGLRDLRRMLGDYDLRVSAVSFITRRGYDDPEEIERRVAATKNVMKFAHGVGAGVVVNHFGLITHEENTVNWKLLIEVLTDIGMYGHQVGARLCGQTGLESGADLKRLLDALPKASVGVDLDPGNLIVGGFSPLEVIDQVGDNILHVHATDGVQDRVKGRGLNVQLGRGMADYPTLLAALERFRYSGYFTLSRDRSENPPLELGIGVKFLKKL
jgi:sugar phosphate isomerase/epimerase